MARFHVGIVGAGVSGLRCADVLLQHGFKVTIIEGRDRIGGRVHQKMLPNGHLVDMGANWVHGTIGNPIYELVKQTNSSVRDVTAASYVFNESGALMQTEQIAKCMKTTWEIFEEASEYSNSLCKKIPPSVSLHDFFTQKVPEKVLSSEEGYEETRNIVMQMSKMWGAFIGSPIQRQSLKFFWLEDGVEGENLFCTGTFQRVLDLIAKPATEKADINFRMRAKKILYQTDVRSKVKIQVNSGQTLEFDEVVVTSPLGWLQRNLNAFEPALPARLTKAIESIGYGCLEKAYISFPKAWWLGPEGDDDRAQNFIHWLEPNYSLANPQRWNQGALPMASFTSETSHPTLLFYFHGPQSHHLLSKAASLPTQDEKFEFFFSFFKPYYSRLPNYSETDPSCKPNNCLTSDWLHDEMAGGGSYSNFQVGLEDGDMHLLTIREGLPDHGLWFAGEHTAPFLGLGTVTGAYWSGESVAERIIKRCQDKHEKNESKTENLSSP